MNLFNIKRSFLTARSRNWNRIYVLVDYHDTISPSNHDNPENKNFYPFSKETLQYLTTRKDICLILFTSSYPEEIKNILKWLKSYNINFDSVNENLECSNNKSGDFSRKIYMNVLLDDKAGFEGKSDWELVLNSFKEESFLN